MKKKIVLMTMMFLLCLSSVAYAADVNVTVDGKPIATKGLLVNGRTLVPLRDIAEQFGLNVQYDDYTGGISLYQGELPRGTIQGNNYTVITAKYYLKNGRWAHQLGSEDYTTDTPIQTINGKTMVPLKVVTDMIKAGVEWDGATNTAVIKKLDTLVKEKEEAQLQEKLANGTVIDIIGDLEGMDSKRDRLGGTLDQRGLTVRSMKAVWDEKENNYWIEYQIFNTSGRDIQGRVYYKVCMFDKETGKFLSESKQRDTSSYLNAGEGSETAESFPNYDPTKHAIDILLVKEIEY